MKLLLDVNVGSTIANALIHAGHDVLRVAQIDPKAEDPDVLVRAAATDAIPVTYDHDFGELVCNRREALPPAVIYIRYEPAKVADAAAHLLSVLDFDALNGHMTVIDSRRTRRTPFPTGGNDND